MIEIKIMVKNGKSMLYYTDEKIVLNEVGLALFELERVKQNLINIKFESEYESKSL